MSANKIKWGLLGSGNIARQFARDLKHSKTGILAAVSSRNLERAQTLAKLGDDVRSFDDYTAMAAWDGIDAVYVATPNALHKAHCLLALDAGKHVLCEKPLAPSAAEAREIAEAAKAAGKFCMEAMWTRFLPAMQQMKEAVATGKIGTPEVLTASLGFARQEAEGDAITDPKLGGGAPMDLGVYGVSIAEYLLGPYTLAHGTSAFSPTGSPRSAALTLRHESGALSVLTASHATQLPNTLWLCGSSARLSLAKPFIHTARVSIEAVNASVPGSGGGSSLKDKLVQSPLWPYLRGIKNTLRPQSRTLISAAFPGGGMQFEADEVGACIAAGQTQSAVMPLESSIRTIETLERAQARRTDA